jgi:hypothetical protein
MMVIVKLERGRRERGRERESNYAYIITQINTILLCNNNFHINNENYTGVFMFSFTPLLILKYTKIYLIKFDKKNTYYKNA